MKLTVDTENKIVQLNEQVELKKLIETLKEMFPETWDQYKIEAGSTVINLPDNNNGYNNPYPYDPFKITWTCM